MSSITLPTVNGDAFVKMAAMPDMIIPCAEGCTVVFGDRAITTTLSAEECKDIFFHEDKGAGKVQAYISDRILDYQITGPNSGFGILCTKRDDTYFDGFREYNCTMYEKARFRITIDPRRAETHVFSSVLDVWISNYGKGVISVEAHEVTDCIFPNKHVPKMPLDHLVGLEQYWTLRDSPRKIIGSAEYTTLVEVGREDKDYHVRLMLANNEYESRIQSARIFKSGLNAVADATVKAAKLNTMGNPILKIIEETMEDKVKRLRAEEKERGIRYEEQYYIFYRH